MNDACDYSQIILASGMTSNFIRNISSEVESLDEEECNKRENFVERWKYGIARHGKCCNYHQTPFCSQRAISRDQPKVLRPIPKEMNFRRLISAEIQKGLLSAERVNFGRKRDYSVEFLYKILSINNHFPPK